MRCIVSFANGRGNYLKGQQRLIDSLKGVGFAGGVVTIKSEEEIGAPSHYSNPYAFKLYAIERAIELGYRQILYVDASVWAVQPVEPVFEAIEKEGYIMQEAGHYVGRWSNEYCLKWFGITREEANKMPMYGNAGLLGLNFDNEIALRFFGKWKDSMLAGCFKGSWTDHRHDMTCGSIIANQLGMKYKSGSDILAYVGGGYAEPKDHIIFYAQGL